MERAQKPTAARARSRRARRASLSQINLRVPIEVEEILEAAVFVSRSRSIQQLLTPVVTAHAEELAKDEKVQAALRARHLDRDTLS